MMGEESCPPGCHHSVGTWGVTSLSLGTAQSKHPEGFRPGNSLGSHCPPWPLTETQILEHIPPGPFQVREVGRDAGGDA